MNLTQATNQKLFLKIFSSLSIFSLFLLLGFTIFSLASPIIKSNATETKINISTELTPVIAISSPEELSLEVLPTVAGAFTSKSLDINVSTNALKGYELYLSSKDETTDMKPELNPTDTVNKISSTFTGPKTSSTMPNNNWGYSLDNTDYNKIPKKSETKQIKNITTFPTTNDLKTTVHFGTKIDTTLASGRYNADIVFTAVAHNNPTRLQGIFTINNMQEMTSNICSKNTTPNKTATQLDTDGSHHGDPNYVPTKTLIDTRDNNTYTVSKLADGKCWMAQNLRIAGKTLTPADSDVRKNYILPASRLSTTDQYGWDGVYVEPQYGGYYSMATMLAGDNDSFQLSPDGKNSIHSICPKNWRLPSTNTSNSDLKVLYSNYNSLSALVSSPVNFTYAGTVYGSQILDPGIFGSYWSSTSYLHLDISKTYWTPDYISSDFNNGDVDGDYYGRSIRCIAR